MGSVLPYDGWARTDTYAVHPYDPGVRLSGVQRLDAPPDGVDAVVSLCRLGSVQVPEPLRPGHVDFRLIDSAAPGANANVAFVLDDAARTVARLRDEGRTVLLHCVAAQSRTPAVAVAYGMIRGVPLETALSDVRRALPECSPNAAFLAALRELARHC